MFPFSNPLNGTPFQNGPGNQQGPQGQQGQQGPQGPGGPQGGQQGNGFQNPFTNWQMPFQSGGSGGGFPFNSDQLQKQISDTIANSMPDFMRGPQSDGESKAKKENPTTKVDVFETHDFVVARIPVTEGQSKPKLSLDTYKLYVRGIQGAENDVTVPLPSPIKPKYTKAEYKSGVLEVRMLKKGPEPMTDITIEG